MSFMNDVVSYPVSTKLQSVKLSDRPESTLKNIKHAEKGLYVKLKCITKLALIEICQPSILVRIFTHIG